MIGWILALTAPILGGIIYGIERKIKARMQRRMGPPILQPFYDFLKLLDKRPMVIHSMHANLGLLHFVAMWLATTVLLTGGDILMAVFIHLFANSFLIIAGFSVQSTYSQLGSMRQLLAILAYEPIFILAGIGFYLATGTFQVSDILALDPTLSSLFLIFAGVVFVLPAKLKKSPFDIAEAHQEIIGGAEIEFSGIFFEAIYTAKWLEYIFAYAFIFVFAGSNYLLGVILMVAVFLITNVIDNTTARLTSKQTVAIALGVSLTLAIINLVGLV